MDAPQALGRPGRWAVAVDAMLALLAAVAWPLSGLRPHTAAALTWLASAWPARQALRRTPIRAYLDA